MQTVIFDLDGTLADTAIITIEAFRRLTPGSGLPMPEPEDIRAAIGYANPEFYDRLYPGFPTSAVRALGSRVEEEELKLMPELAGELLFPGVRELLAALRHKGIRLYIASTGSAEHVEAVVAHTGIGGFFVNILCGEPDKAGMIGRILAAGDPADFLMVGDKAKDSEGANANGIKAIGACYGYCSRGQYGFDRYIDAPHELLALVSTGILYNR